MIRRLVRLTCYVRNRRRQLGWIFLFDLRLRFRSSAFLPRDHFGAKRGAGVMKRRRHSHRKLIVITNLDQHSKMGS